MPSKEQEKICKLTGKLVEVLHGEYSDTRDLAVVQLALLGEKVVPYICSFLKKEGDLESDLIEYNKMHIKWAQGPQLTDPVDSDLIPMETHYSKDEVESIEIYEKMTKFQDDFKKKWGCYPREHGETDKDDSEQRRHAVEGALEALSLIGDSKAIAVLKKLPIFNYEARTELETVHLGKAPLFERVKETVEKIKLANELSV